MEGSVNHVEIVERPLCMQELRGSKLGFSEYFYFTPKDKNQINSDFKAVSLYFFFNYLMSFIEISCFDWSPV